MRNATAGIRPSLPICLLLAGGVGLLLRSPSLGAPASLWGGSIPLQPASPPARVYFWPPVPPGASFYTKPGIKRTRDAVFRGYILTPGTKGYTLYHFVPLGGMHDPGDLWPQPQSADGRTTRREDEPENWWRELWSLVLHGSHMDHGTHVDRPIRSPVSEVPRSAVPVGMSLWQRARAAARFVREIPK
jgi:hypothetical protein